jgi:acetamidase/formamidase
MANTSVLPAAGTQGRTHYFPSDRVHFTWDADNEPVLTVASGDTVVVHTRDVSDNQITPESTVDAIASLDWDRVYPLAGPIAVEGAQPGHTLGVEIVDLPIAPFLGTMGVCPAGASQQAVMPPGTFGGNMDTRQLVRGTTLFLPVQVDGALFSCGDAHAAQGDGEVCVTGIESPMYAALRLTLHEDRSIPAPQYSTSPGSLTPHVDSAGFYGTTGVGPDLYIAAQEAVRAMIDHLAESYDLSREDAYVLSSLSVDLKISEIVDAGQYVVSAVLPLAVFRDERSV